MNEIFGIKLDLILIIFFKAINNLVSFNRLVFTLLVYDI